jgi:3-dehydroquinate synthase
VVAPTESYVAAGSRIAIAPRLLSSLADHLDTTAHRVVIITDSNVGPLHAATAAAALAALHPVVLTMPAGEEHKTRATWAQLTDELLALGAGRDTVIVALGGGVVGDVAGFVAATYLRGVPVVQVPTSLLAMIDAAIGGKTGLDVPAGKNLVGAFHAPALIAIDPTLLATLPARELRAGLAEAIKHGVIRDAEYFAMLREAAPLLSDPASAAREAMRGLISRSVAIKSAVVSNDPREQGERKILNFGHTLGHAIEAASGYALRHGEAIAIGMVLEARLGEALGVTAAGTSEAVRDAVERAGLPSHTTLDAAELVARTATDKKKTAGQIEYALPAHIGAFDRWTVPVPDEIVLTVLRAQ